MRYRRTSEDGDYVFGSNGADYLRDIPEAVGQAVLTRLRLLKGEWFMDVEAGTDWQTKILGMHTAGTRDLEILSEVSGTEGLLRVLNFSSRLNSETRIYTVQMIVSTVYGTTAVEGSVNQG